MKRISVAIATLIVIALSGCAVEPDVSELAQRADVSLDQVPVPVPAVAAPDEVCAALGVEPGCENDLRIRCTTGSGGGGACCLFNEFEDPYCCTWSPSSGGPHCD